MSVFATMVLNPLVLVIAAAIGCAICRAGGASPHAADMLLAGGVCLVAGGVAMIPVALVRSSAPADVFQSAFLGTVIHLGLSLVLAAVVMFTVRPGMAFVWWLLAMFWITLIAQSAVFVRRMRTPVRSSLN